MILCRPARPQAVMKQQFTDKGPVNLTRQLSPRTVGIAWPLRFGKLAQSINPRFIRQR